MESMESQEAGFPPFPHSLEIPSGLPHSHGLGCWHISKYKSMRDRSQGLLDLKGAVTEVLGPKCNERSSTLTPLPCLLSMVRRREFPPCIYGRFLLLGSYGVGDRATISDSRSNFHTRVGYRTNVCRRRLASDLGRASEVSPAPGGSRGSP